MSAEANVRTIQQFYDAFGRGDVQAILEGVTDDVDWAADTSSTKAPWYGPHEGRGTVPSFFEAFGRTMEIKEFVPHTFGTNDDSVFALVRCRARSRATGKAIDMTLHHYFRFRDGKVCYYRGTEDTAQTEAALQ